MSFILTWISVTMDMVAMDTVAKVTVILGIVAMAAILIDYLVPN